MGHARPVRGQEPRGRRWVMPFSSSSPPSFFLFSSQSSFSKGRRKKKARRILSGEISPSVPGRGPRRGPPRRGERRGGPRRSCGRCARARRGGGWRRRRGPLSWFVFFLWRAKEGEEKKSRARESEEEEEERERERERERESKLDDLLRSPYSSLSSCLATRPARANQREKERERAMVLYFIKHTFSLSTTRKSSRESGAKNEKRQGGEKLCGLVFFVFGFSCVTLREEAVGVFISI